jgi:ABC-type enterochelin transport system permease subunit|tara:strand:+ start:462 stop:719 length:258 start_codon:yes stop_codon:yes gene_type:complete
MLSFSSVYVILRSFLQFFHSKFDFQSSTTQNQLNVDHQQAALFSLELFLCLLTYFSKQCSKDDINEPLGLSMIHFLPIHFSIWGE